MKKTTQIYASKPHMLSLLIGAIAVFGVSLAEQLIFDIQNGYFSVIDILAMAINFLCIAGSVVLLFFNPKNRGKAILVALGIYLIVEGTFSLCLDIYFVTRYYYSGYADYISYAEYISSYIPSFVIASCQIVAGILSLVFLLLDRVPLVSIIPPLAFFSYFFINEIVGMVRGFPSNPLSIVYDFLYLFFCLMVMVVLAFAVKHLFCDKKKVVEENVD